MPTKTLSNGVNMGPPRRSWVDPSEAGSTPNEAGSTPSEAGPTPSEAGPTSNEAGPTPNEAGPTPMKLGPSEAKPTVSLQGGGEVPLKPLPSRSQHTDAEGKHAAL